MGRGNNSNLLYGAPARSGNHANCKKYSAMIEAAINPEAISKIDYQRVFDYFPGNTTIFTGQQFTPPDESYDFLSKYSGIETFLIRQPEISDQYLRPEVSQKVIPANEIKSFEFDGGLYELACRTKKLEDKTILENTSKFSLSYNSELHNQGQLFGIQLKNPEIFSDSQMGVDDGYITLGELTAVEDIFGSDGDWLYSGSISAPGSAIYTVNQQPVAAVACGSHAGDYQD